MTTIRIHFLGGTIGYAGAPDGEPVRLSAEALLAAVPGLDLLPVTLDVHAADAGAQRVPHVRAGLGPRLRRGGGRLRCRQRRTRSSWCRAPTPWRSRATCSTCCGTGRNRSCSPGRCATPPWPGPTDPPNLLAAVSVAADPRFRELRRARRAGRRGARAPASVQKVHTTRPHAFALARRRTAGGRGRGTTDASAAARHPSGHPPADRAPHRTGAGPRPSAWTRTRPWSPRLVVVADAR